MKKLTKAILLMASAAGAIAAFNYYINTKNNKYANCKNTLPEIDKLNYNWKLGNISYNKTGNGSPILLLHKLDCGHSNSEWNDIIKMLGKKHTVYAIDLLGCGLSDRPYIQYTNFVYVQLINDFISDIIGTKTDIITSDNSASLAAMANKYNPDNINKMVFINPDIQAFSNPVVTYSKKYYEILMGIPLIGTFVYNILFSQDKCGDDDYYFNAHYNNSKSKYLFASMENNLTDISIKDAIKTAKNKIHIISGEYNDECDEIFDAFTYYNNKISTEIVPESDGFPHIENPDDTLGIINNFIK